MDHLDHVSETEQQILDMRLKAVTQHSTRPSARFCAECGNDIPEERRVALPGVQLCVGCKEVQEIKKRNHR